MKISLILLCFLSNFCVLAQVNLSSGLTACYSLDGNASDPINSLNGTLGSVTSSINRFNVPNTAYYFAGNDSSFIELPNSPLLKSTEVSFSAWVRFSHLNSAQYIVFAHNGCFNYHEGYMLCVNDWVPGGYRLQMAKADNSCSLSGQSTLNGATVLAPLTWYHVGFYIGSDSLKLYLNGTLETTMSSSSALLYNPFEHVYLGGSNISHFNVPLDGSIDNVRFYNRKLNGAEMMALYSQDPFCRLDHVGLNQDVTDLSTIQVYPNPSENYFLIESENLSEVVEYWIEDCSGVNFYQAN